MKLLIVAVDWKDSCFIFAWVIVGTTTARRFGTPFAFTVAWRHIIFATNRSSLWCSLSNVLLQSFCKTTTSEHQRSDLMIVYRTVDDTLRPDWRVYVTCVCSVRYARVITANCTFSSSKRCLRLRFSCDNDLLRTNVQLQKFRRLYVFELTHAQKSSGQIWMYL